MIEMFDYRRGLTDIRGKLESALGRVLDSGQLILGPETRKFEQEFAAWTGAEECVAMSSGTMALFCALRACEVGVGDQVITVSNTCAPTIAAIRLTGAVPVFVDVDPDTLMMNVRQVEAALTDRTRCIVPVHLWGNAVDMQQLCELAADTKVAVIEDCAQALGTTISDNKVGNYGDIGCYSFYPTKHLGAYGDAGAAVTSNKRLAQRLRLIRMYGYHEGISEIEGANARVNELQCAFLRIKLNYLDGYIQRRREIAAYYNSILSGLYELPGIGPDISHSFHQFVIRHKDRAQVTALLDDQRIGWAIHYPVPVHRMPAYAQFKATLPVTEEAAEEIVSIPVHEFLTDSEVQTVARVLGDIAT